MKIVFILLVLFCTKYIVSRISNNEEKLLCNQRGTFNKINNNCSCITGYISYPYNATSQCNYEQKSSNSALFLSLIAGYAGIDMIYLGHSKMAFFKLLFPITLILINLILLNLNIMIKIR